MTMRARQHGIAVITAMLLTTLAITLVASLFWQQQVQVRSVENQRMQLQKQWILRGALDWASLILREDARMSVVDTLDEPWAVPLAETRLDQYIENRRSGDSITNATLSGGISDAQARYNLTNLSTSGMVNYGEVAVFERLLDGVELNPVLARATAQMTADAQKRAAANSAGMDASLGQTLEFAHLEDLLAVPGFSTEAVGKIRDKVIFLPRATPLNINTSQVEVLTARMEMLAPSDAALLVASRNTASFRDIADFSSRLPENPLTVSAKEVAVSSSFFLVNGKVQIDRAGLEVQALVERIGESTKVIWIREY